MSTQVVEAVVRLLARVGLRAVRGAHHGVVVRQRGDARAGRRAAGDRRRVALGEVRLVGRPAAWAEDVRLPVVEVHLRRLADLAGRLVGVVDVRERDVDLILARALDLRLGDAELVDALAHDLDRAVDRLAGDLRLLRRLGLVDERGRRP